MSFKVKIGEVLMLKNGNRAIILHQDDFSQAVIYYDYTLKKNCTASFNAVADGFLSIGLWDIEWPKELSYYDGIISVVKSDAHARILGNKEVVISTRAIERKVELFNEKIEPIEISEQKIIWQVSHQEFFKKIEIFRGGNVLKIIRDTYESLASAIDADAPETIIVRVPVEFNIFHDAWTAQRYLAVYARFSFIKDGEQKLIEWGEKCEQ